MRREARDKLDSSDEGKQKTLTFLLKTFFKSHQLGSRTSTFVT